MSLAATPFLVLGERRHKTLELAIATHARKWQTHWSGRDAPPEIGVDACSAHPASLWRQGATGVWAGDDGAPTLLVPEDALARLAGVPASETSVASGNHGTRLVDALEAQSVTDLAGRLGGTSIRSCYARTAHSVAEALREAGAHRAVLARIAWHEPRLIVGVVLSPASIASLLGEGARRSAAGLRPRRDGIADEIVHLRMELGVAQLSLGELRELRVGDVIVLDEELGAAGKLVVAGTGGIAARATLGRAECARAVQIC
jgi:flagellar motor switch/type III secretory pathway protein FliN